MKLSFLLPLISFLALVVLLGKGLTLNPQDLPSTLINKPVPAFELAQLHESKQHFKPEQLLGQKWILNVWASWCASCRIEHPLLNQLAQANKLTIVGLNYKDENHKAKQWLAERGNPYAYIAVDALGNAGIDLGVYAVPETFVINEQGIVIYKHLGPLTPHVITNEILPLM